MLRIGIDIDGVLTDFVKEFIKSVNKRYKITLSEQDIREHDLYKVLGIPSKDLIEMVMEVFPKDLAPQEGSVESVNELSKKHEIYIITAREPETLDVSKNWLKQHGIPYKKLAFMKEGDKHKFIEKDHLDIVIDDNLKEITNWIGIVPHIIVLDHPWNQSLNVKNYFHRAKDWKEILSIIKEIEKEN
ncbi:MAG: hypothetical protein OEW49_04700 [Nitrosopumilus sp.]|nr:hypothetical protein [Nitrosopumilus sp.]